MTPEPAGQARARIRNAALRLFAEHGEQRVSMRQIATSAGVAVGSIQHHFCTRDGLVQAVDEMVIDHFADAIASADQADESRTPAAIIASRDEAVQRMLQANPTLFNHLRREVLAPASGGRLLQRLTALVQREVQRARASGMASTVRRESTQVSQVLVRQIGSLTQQPLVDAAWRQIESDPTAIKLHLRVSISMDDGSSSAAVAPETAGSDATPDRWTSRRLRAIHARADASKMKRRATALAQQLGHTAVCPAAAHHQRGCMRMAPSRRMDSPFM